MNDFGISSQEELYARIRPALRSKKRILNKNGYKTVSEQDIWDYLRMNKWADSTGLELCDMVDDILHVDNELVAQYSHNKYMNTLEEKEEKVNKNSGIEFELPKLKS